MKYSCSDFFFFFFFFFDSKKEIVLKSCDYYLKLSGNTVLNNEPFKKKKTFVSEEV